MENSNLKSTTDEELPSEMAAKAKVLDDIYDKLTDIVTSNGPLHLIRGMSALEANTAILECIESLKNQRDLAFRIIDSLPSLTEGCTYCDTDPNSPQLKELKCLRQTTG